jgi:hypothetical protein
MTRFQIGFLTSMTRLQIGFLTNCKIDYFRQKRISSEQNSKVFKDSKLLLTVKLPRLLFKCMNHCSNYPSHYSIAWSRDHCSNDRITVQTAIVTVQLPGPEITVQVTIQLTDVTVQLTNITVHLLVHVFTVHFTVSSSL